MARRRSSNASVMRLLRTQGSLAPKVFKSEGREIIRRKRRIFEKRFFRVPKILELVKDVAGCVGQVNPGTVIRLNLQRTTPVGKMYFFDAFHLTEDRNLEWLGEFDTMRIDDIAAGIGKEVAPEEYVKVLIPDESGILTPMVGSMIEFEGAGDLRPED